MRRINAIKLAIVGVLSSGSPLTGALAWEASYPTGKVSGSDEFFAAEVDAAVPPKEPVTLGQQVVAYPQLEGADLGLGWDLLQSKKTNSTCIRFTEKTDNYQNVSEKLQDVVDQETLDIALNANFAGSAKGSIYVFKGDVNFSNESKFSYHYASKDEVFVARASVLNGVRFVAPKDADVSLTPDMAKLLKDNPEGFRRRCGDGFISSIRSGADLYLLLHFHDFDEHTRGEIDSSFKAAGGVGDIFGGSAQGGLQAIVDKTRKQGQLDIEFTQNGGQIKSLPIDLPTAKKKVADLPVEARNGPLPLYMVISPYTDLPGVGAMKLFTVVDKRQRAIRYFERLITLFYEITEVQKDYFRDRRNDASKDAYYYSYYHTIRPENIVGLRDEVLQELRLVSTIVRDLDDKDCGVGSTAARCGGIIPKSNADGQSCATTPSDITCKSLNERSAKTDFDDLKFWIRLPVPANAISDVERSALATPPSTVPLQERQREYAHTLYYHWIERITEVRCSTFKECLSDTDSVKYQKAIQQTFGPVTPAISLLKSPNNDADFALAVAPGFTAWVIVGYNDPNQKATQFSIFEKSPQASAWEQTIANHISGYGKRYTIEATEDGFHLGLTGFECNFTFMSGCDRRWFAKGAGFADPLTANARYYDAGQTQSANWDLELKVRAFPDPAFR